MSDKNVDQKEIDNKIEEYVLVRMGRPKTLRYFKVNPLWDCYYRVNVYCEKETNILVKTNEITDSFFVKFKDDKVRMCRPEILEKKY